MLLSWGSGKNWRQCWVSLSFLYMAGQWPLEGLWANYWLSSLRIGASVLLCVTYLSITTLTLWFFPRNSTYLWRQSHYIVQVARWVFLVQCKGTFLSEDNYVFVKTPNRRTFFFPETENLNFGDWKLPRNWECLKVWKLCKGKKVTFGRLGQH